MENAWVVPGRFVGMEGSEGGSLPLDVHETTDELVVTSSLPGVRSEDIDVTIQGNMLRIQGETKPPEHAKDEQVHRRERRYGRFFREITLPSTVKSDSVRAEFDNGVLTLHLPKTEEAKPRRIQVQSGGGGSRQQQIEGRAA
jgi:HSP20 family protein